MPAPASTPGGSGDQKHKTFTKQKAGKKVKNRKEKDGRQRHNAKAFTFSGGYVGRVRAVQRGAAVFQKRAKRHLVTKVPDVNPPPFNVVVHGPRGCGKTTFIRSFAQYYSKEKLDKVKGPITVVANKYRRLTFLECPPDNVGAMIDLAKIGDVIVLMVNATVGLENDTFEMINTLQQHGFPRVWLAFSHLDEAAKKGIQVKQKAIKKRFWKETHPGNKVYAMGAIDRRTQTYRKIDVMRIAKKLQTIQRHPLSFRELRSYSVPLQFRDVTPDEEVNANEETDRSLELFGYVQGARMRPGSTMHIPGAGDFELKDVEIVDDPCPLPSKQGSIGDGGRALRKLNDTDKKLYAPYSAKGAHRFDKGSLYIKLPSNQMLFTPESQLIRAKGEVDPLTLADIEVPQSIQDMRDLHQVKATELQSALDDEVFCLLPGMPTLKVDDDQDHDKDQEDDDDSDRSDDESSSSSDESSDEEEETLLATLAPGSDHRDTTYDQVPSSLWLMSGPLRSSESFPQFDRILSTTKQSAVDESPKTLGNAISTLFMMWSDKGVRATIKTQRFTSGTKDGYESMGTRPDRQSKDIHQQAVDELKSAQEDKKRREKEFLDFAGGIETQGAPIGSFVRMKIESVPFKWVVHRATNLKIPIIAGTVLPGETAVGQVQCTVRMHRWNQRQLKTTDPVLVSVGWRRYQTTPTYGIEHRGNVRQAYLKYTPMHTHCLATFRGPAVAPGTGVMIIKNFVDRVQYYRISATGSVKECAESFPIKKKIKLTGQPAMGPDKKPLIAKNSAVVEGMFNSNVEASKCKGAKIQTVSGIRGKIKAPSGATGLVRCSFEGTIRPGDIITMKLWGQVECKLLYNPVVDIPTFRRMRSIAELRHAYEKPLEDASSSAYRTRQARYEVDKPHVRLPASLKRVLPLDEVLKGHVIQDKSEVEQDEDVLASTRVLHSKEDLDRDEMKRKMEFIRDDRFAKVDIAKEAKFAKIAKTDRRNAEQKAKKRKF